MNLTRRLVLIVTAICFLVTNSGCTTTRVRSVQEEMDRSGSDLLTPGGQRVSGFTTADGTHHDFQGQMFLVGSDSLAFRKLNWEIKVAPSAPSRAGSHSRYREERLYAVTDVTEVQVVHTKTAATAALMTTTTLVGLVLVALASKESCPFLYSWDGEQYVFDGEPYGGATMSSLQRTDYSELEHLRARDGEYRLRIGNEVDETQHTDALHLLVADHPAGTRAVMDREGRVHCFRELATLSAARDESGRDLLACLRECDQSAWNPDLAGYAAQDSLSDTRNHITLEFPRPAGTEPVALVANVGTGQWGSHMIRVMLGLRGNRVQEFYDAVNGSVDYQRQLAAWNDREDLFALDVEVLVGDHWERRGELHGGGPFISELRTIPLDLTGVEGATLRLRLHPPVGFWRFESFRLGLGETAAEVVTVAAAKAVDHRGADVRARLAAEDGDCLDQPTTEDWAELTFAAPPASPGRERTVFAVTRGWYGIHLYADGPPEIAALERLAYEPGYAVRRALAEFADFTRTGRLGYVKPAVAVP